MSFIHKVYRHDNIAHSTSGAFVIEDTKTNTIIKFGTSPSIVERLSKQALSIITNQHSPHLPKIIELYDDGYRMEKLYPIEFINHRDFFTLVVSTLQDILYSSFWRNFIDNETFKKFRPQWKTEFYNYATNLLYLSSGYDRSLAFRHIELIIDNDVDVQLCNVHGDCTLDNMMRRGLSPNAGQTVVLIDPLPWQTTKLLPIKYVDLAKILQSLYGYEIAIGRLPLNHEPALIGARDSFLKTLEPLERGLVYSYCVIHYLRLLPYQRSTKHLDNCVNILNGVLDDAKI